MTTHFSRSIKGATVLGAFALGATSLGAQDVTARLGWLAGCWEARDGTRTTFEMWSPPQGGLLVGAGRTVVDGRARAYEHLRLHAEGDTLFYTAVPSDQTETHFRSTAVSDSSFTVENPEHDFPQRLIYRRVGADSLSARVEGPGPNGPRGFTLHFTRVGCGTDGRRQTTDGRRQTTDGRRVTAMRDAGDLWSPRTAVTAAPP